MEVDQGTIVHLELPCAVDPPTMGTPPKARRVSGWSGAFFSAVSLDALNICHCKASCKAARTKRGHHGCPKASGCFGCPPRIGSLERSHLPWLHIEERDSNKKGGTATRRDQQRLLPIP